MYLHVTLFRVDGFVDDVYQPTLKMSTYLLAFFFGMFEHTQTKTSTGVLFRAWSRPESLEQTEVAKTVGSKTTENYEKYFNISFPLPKQGSLIKCIIEVF